MGLKTKVHVVDANNRDKGKRFLLTEMPARQAEKWAAKAFLALAKSGHDLGSVRTGGMAALAVAGLEALQYLEFHDAEPLMDEMMTCVRIIPDPKHPETSRAIVDEGLEGDDIEEVETRVALRFEVFKLHTDFFTRAGR